AMIAIDVNSGKMRDGGDAENTAYKTNVEAVDEICRQLRLRDIGGLVVCDLIDMHGRGNRRKIETQFRDRLKKDRAATRTLPISRFGIVEMTRQRVRGSMRDVHFARCPTCTGRGFLQRPESVVTEVLRDLAALLEHDKVAKVELVVSARVASEILSTRRAVLSRIEHAAGKHVDMRVVEGIPVDRVNLYAYDASGSDIELERLPRLKPPKSLKEWVDTSAPDDDWAVDINEEAIEETVLEAEHLPAVDDGADLPDDANWTGEDQEEAPKKKRRRRRRRRRSGSGEDEAEGRPETEAQDDASEPAEAEHRREDGEAGGEEGEGGGRRKRRRRRRRGRGGREERDGDESANGSVARPAASTDVDDDDEEDDEGGVAPDPSVKRGDSWDLTPEEIEAAEARRAKALAALKSGADETTDETPAPTTGESGGGKKKRRRSRRKKSGTAATPTGDSDAAAPAEVIEADTETEAEPAAEAPAKDTPVAETSADENDSAARKVTRRRRKKATTRKADDDGADEAPRAGASDDTDQGDDDGTAPDDSDPAPARKKTSRKRRSSKQKTGTEAADKSGKTGGGASGTTKSDARSSAADGKPTVETRMTKTALAAQVREAGGTGDGTRKPPRTLYSSRRRVSPSDLKQRRDRE
ncbi:MAG: ribonuclease E/G, partial [Phycisphaerales bacterium]|nr:ribonuclease E/G [Phycisphaerales bacterium]